MKHYGSVSPQTSFTSFQDVYRECEIYDPSLHIDAKNDAIITNLGTITFKEETNTCVVQSELLTESITVQTRKSLTSILHALKTTMKKQSRKTKNSKIDTPEKLAVNLLHTAIQTYFSVLHRPANSFQSVITTAIDNGGEYYDEIRVDDHTIAIYISTSVSGDTARLHYTFSEEISQQQSSPLQKMVDSSHYSIIDESKENCCMKTINFTFSCTDDMRGLYKKMRNMWQDTLGSIYHPS